MVLVKIAVNMRLVSGWYREYLQDQLDGAVFSGIEAAKPERGHAYCA